MSFRCNRVMKELWNILPGWVGGRPGSRLPSVGRSRSRSTKPRLFQELEAARLRSGLICSLKGSRLYGQSDTQRRGLGPLLLKQARWPPPSLPPALVFVFSLRYFGILRRLFLSSGLIRGSADYWQFNLFLEISHSHRKRREKKGQYLIWSSNGEKKTKQKHKTRTCV